MQLIHNSTQTRAILGTNDFEIGSFTEGKIFDNTMPKKPLADKVSDVFFPILLFTFFNL